MRNCFNQILICLNLSDSLHIIFAILDGVRNNFESSYPTVLMKIFPYFHYPFYRWAITKEALIIFFKCMFSIGLEYLQNEMKASEYQVPPHQIVL